MGIDCRLGHLGECEDTCTLLFAATGGEHEFFLSVSEDQAVFAGLVGHQHE